MILNLIRKDFLLVKKYIFPSMILPILIPIFFSFRAPVILGFTAIMMSVMLTGVLMLGNVLIEEEKYPKAEMLLCTSPYTRKMMVLEKYIFILIILVYCYMSYNIAAILIPGIQYLDIKLILTVSLIATVLFGAYIPLQNQWGIQKTKLVLSVSVFVVPLLLTSIKNIGEGLININNFMIEPSAMQYIILLLASLFLGSISFYVSNKIYSKKDF